MKYYILSGEASGDLHGSNLVKELLLIDHTTNIRCWGGDLMHEAGATVVKHYRDLAFMGFAEVIKNLPTILSNIQFCKEDILSFNPDVLILIDYPGFNLRIAEWAKKKGYTIVYYISPQVWAWKANRVKKMKVCIDKMLVILPFEKQYYKDNWNWEVEYVGHPLLEVVEKYTTNASTELNNEIGSSKPIVALLPGSRKQEIAVKLPIMLEVAKEFPDYQFVIAKAPGQTDAYYSPFLEHQSNIITVRNATYSLLSKATAALVTSGTATLETALFGVPEVVCYKGSNISYQIAKRLVKVKYISLVNLIMDKLVVKEYIQNEMNTNNLVQELKSLLQDETRKQQIATDYADLKAILNTGGNASRNAANSIHSLAILKK